MTTEVAQVDLTAPSDSLTYAEILTPAGIVRVNANLYEVRTGQPVVVVEITPNTSYRAQTAPGGDWSVDVRDVGPGVRTDVRLVRRDEPPAAPHRGAEVE